MYKFSIESFWNEATKMAKERHEQKKNYASCKQLSPNYELVGILGEMLFSRITGMEMDKELRVSGDDGFDFPDINIKTSEEHKARHLIEYLDKEFVGFYVFVVVNLEEKYGYIKGYMPSEQFDDLYKIVDFGYGPRKAVELEHLWPFSPKNAIMLDRRQ